MFYSELLAYIPHYVSLYECILFSSSNILLIICSQHQYECSSRMLMHLTLNEIEQFGIWW